MQTPYDNLSDIYDKFNNDFDYKKYLDRIFSKFDLPGRGLVLDCGCGTGSLLCELLDRGYDGTGVDGSENMLDAAREKLAAHGHTPHLVCQPLQQLDLYGAYDIVFCSLDTVNHLTSTQEVRHFFRDLYHFVEPNGWFVFDIKTRKAFESSVGARVSQQADDILIVEGAFGKRYASYQFTAFEQLPGGLYRKQEDYIEERFYESTEIKKWLLEAGFVYRGRTQLKNRILFAAQKQGPDQVLSATDDSQNHG